MLRFRGNATHNLLPRNRRLRKASIDGIDDLTELRLRFLEEIGYVRDGVQKVIREHLELTLPTGEFMAWIAEEDGRSIATSGMMFLQKPPHGRNLPGKGGFVLNMYTLPHRRSRGICTALMETIIGFVREASVTCIPLHTSHGGVGIDLRKLSVTWNARWQVSMTLMRRIASDRSRSTSKIIGTS